MKKILSSLFSMLIAVFVLVPATSYAQDYIIGEGDVVKISVYDHDDLSTVTRVGGDGFIIFPLIGQVKVAGMTIGEITGKIAGLLADGYVINPNVTVFIQEFRSKKAFIMGEVQKPGLYILPGQTTLLALLSEAGGLNKDAGDKGTIKRKSNGPDQRESFITVDLRALLGKGDTSLDIPIMDGDSVYVPKAGLFYVTGEVKKPDAYRYEEGTTVIKAVTMAGGFTDIASKGKVKVIRKAGGKEQVFEKVRMDYAIFPDDVVVVPESFF